MLGASILLLGGNKSRILGSCENERPTLDAIGFDNDAGVMAFLLLLDDDWPKNSSQLERPDVKSSSERLASGGGSNDVLVVVRCFGFGVLLMLLLLLEAALLRSTLG